MPRRNTSGVIASVDLEPIDRFGRALPVARMNSYLDVLCSIRLRAWRSSMLRINNGFGPDTRDNESTCWLSLNVFFKKTFSAKRTKLVRLTWPLDCRGWSFLVEQALPMTETSLGHDRQGQLIQTKEWKQFKMNFEQLKLKSINNERGNERTLRMNRRHLLESRLSKSTKAEHKQSRSPPPQSFKVTLKCTVIALPLSCWLWVAVDRYWLDIGQPSQSNSGARKRREEFEGISSFCPTPTHLLHVKTAVSLSLSLFECVSIVISPRKRSLSELHGTDAHNTSAPVLSLSPSLSISIK
jgi:hypothetical protein